MSHSSQKSQDLAPGTRVLFAVPPGPLFYDSLLALIRAQAVPVLADPGMGLFRFLACHMSARPQLALTALGKQTRLVRTPFYYSKPSPELFSINFTTGSTGPAKGAIYTQTMFEAMLESVRTLFRIDSNSTVYSTLPAFGLFARLLGAKATLEPTSDTTHVFTSPAFLRQIEFKNMPNLREVACGGAAPAENDIPRLSSKINFQVTYGATEALPIATTTNYQPGCLGKIVPGIEVQIIDQEICVSGPRVSSAYYRNESANLQHKFLLGTKLWHRTGDLGYFDSHQQLWSLGRKSERVHTAEGALDTAPVENYYNLHFNRRTALVGLGPKDKQIPIICVEKKPFPVDSRHRSKIKRAELARWVRKNPTRLGLHQGQFGPIKIAEYA